MKVHCLAGLLSGTSLDGVDAAAIHEAAGSPTCVATPFTAFSNPLRKKLLHLAHAESVEVGILAAAERELTTCYHSTLQQLQERMPAGHTLTAAGCHGQTIRHWPDKGFTWQLLDPSMLALASGLPIVADFRRKDLADGGQGAPLVPAFLQHLSLHHPGIWLNLGGIANLSIHADPEQVVTGMDCGPANTLLDAVCRECLAMDFDPGGQHASRGTVASDMLAALLAEPWFARKAPKSTGPELFNIEWLGRHYPTWRSLPVEDVLATLVALTCEAIAAVLQEQDESELPMYVFGGGCHNQHLMAALQKRLGRRKVVSTRVLGLDPDFIEAQAFAWLAGRCLSRQAGNLPGVTGARGPRVLGGIYWPE